jgi:CRISPR type IV-associated protein Csf3
MGYQPFKISVRLDRPIHVGGHPVAADGVLSALVVEAAAADGHPDPWSVQHELPLERHTTASGQWVFKASVFRPQAPDMPYSFSMVSRVDAHQAAYDLERGVFQTKQVTPHIGGGAFKMSFFPVLAQWAEAWEAHAVGDIDVVRELLGGLTHLGGRRGIGLGAIRSIEVIPEEANVLWTDRALPSDFEGETARPMAGAMVTLAAPYWKRSNAVEALLPM